MSNVEKLFSENADILDGIRGDTMLRPSILDPKKPTWRIFDLDEAAEDPTSLGEVLEGRIVSRSSSFSGYVALSRLMRGRLNIDNVLSPKNAPKPRIMGMKGRISINEDFTLGELTKRIVDHNRMLPEGYNLSVPIAMTHKGYDSSGDARISGVACASVFLAISLGEGVARGSTRRHALRPIDVADSIYQSKHTDLRHDLIDHYLKKYQDVPPEMYCNMPYVQKLRAALTIPFDEFVRLDGTVSTATNPTWLDEWTNEVDNRKTGRANDKWSLPHKLRATSPLLSWMYRV